MSETTGPISALVSASVISRTRGANPSYWRNTYEFESTSLLPGLAVGPADYDALGQALAQAHTTLLSNAYVIDRVVVSSIAQDGEPYAPNTFAVVDAQLDGVFTDGGVELPLETTVVVSKEVVAGRSGRVLLRGAIGVNSLVEVIGGTVISGPEVDRINAAFAGVIAAAATSGWQMVLARQPGLLTAFVRPVTAGRVKGLGSKQLRSPRRLKPVGAARKLLGALSDLNVSASEINTVIGAFNSLPFPDLPLLPGLPES